MKITKRLVTNYSIITDSGEYGNFIIGLEKNLVSVMADTSFGIYANTWTAPGEDSFDFLTKLRFNYTMGKFKKVFSVLDAEKTLILLEKKLDSIKIDTVMDKEKIEDLKEQDKDICDMNLSIKEYINEIYCSELLNAIYDNDYSLIDYEVKVDSDCLGFWNELWIPLINHMKEEKS